MARKRSTSCVANGRDSPGQNLGVKCWGGQTVKIGAIILRQKGTKFYPSFNVKMGRDHTLYAAKEGKVTFGFSQGAKRTVSVI